MRQTPIDTINPATGDVITTYTAHSQRDIEILIDSAHRAFFSWRSFSLADRVQCLHRLGSLLEIKRDVLASQITCEMGKLITEAESEIEKCVWLCQYYAENAEKFLQPEVHEINSDKAHVEFAPIGVVLAVMPWNFPFWQVFRCAVPALMAGNTVLLKHARNVTGCALEIEALFQAADFPTASFASIIAPSELIAPVIEHPNVRAVSLTGSVDAGRSVAARAAKNLKKTVLELGGSDPYIVLDDADIEYSAKTILQSRLLNCGQSCIGAKRIIVAQQKKSELENVLTELMSEYLPGSPTEKDTKLAPMARRDLRDMVNRQVQHAIDDGAKLLRGGEIPEGYGAFYPATLMTDLTPNSILMREEIFGPVVSIFEMCSDEEGVELANATPFGLGGAVFSADLERAQAVATKIDSGVVAINDFVRSDPRLPFGGVKDSGYGRELSHYGIKEFVNIKTITLKS